MDPGDVDPDQELARALARREASALREAYERHGTRVQRLCLRLLGRVADAEDAAQEVFVRLLERARDFDGRARFSTWLYRLTVNLCLHRLERERLRRARRLPADEGALVDPGEAPHEALSRNEARAHLSALLARLSGEHRAVLVLRELEGLSYREIAAVLALPEGTVMSRLSRARERLIELAATRPAVDPAPVPRALLDPS
jgi:RNA polymerase sigma-70 factor (ECF subfamily)